MTNTQQVQEHLPGKIENQLNRLADSKPYDVMKLHVAEFTVMAELALEALENRNGKR